MKHVLIADDSATVRSAISYAAKFLGLQVSEASDGLQAWALLEKNRYDALLTDWNMPGLNVCARSGPS